MKDRYKEIHKEIIRYVFGGGITTIFALLSYSILKAFIGDYKTANLLSIILTKMLAYVVNKVAVFRTRNTFREDIKEIVRYIIARGSTGVIDWLGQVALVDFLGENDVVSKIIMIIITTILNYLLCSFQVFKKEQIKDNRPD